jgi:hypothetical protein
MPEKRTYTEGELRIMRVFVVLLFSFGVFSGIAGFLSIGKQDSTPSETSEVLKEYKKHKTKAKMTENIPMACFLLSITFISLAIAGGYAVRRVIKNNLRDIELDPIKEKCAQQGDPSEPASPPR